MLDGFVLWSYCFYCYDLINLFNFELLIKVVNNMFDLKANFKNGNEVKNGWWIKCLV